MGSLNVTVSFDLRGFESKRSSEKFVNYGNLDQALNEIRKFFNNHENWAYHNLKLVDTKYVPLEGEGVDRYTVKEYEHGPGFVVWDNEYNGPGYQVKLIIFGPEHKDVCESVSEFLNMRNEGEKEELPEPIWFEGFTDESGETYGG